MARSAYAVLLPMFAAVFGSAFDDSCPYQVCHCYDNIINCDVNGLQTLPAFHYVNTPKSYYLFLNGDSLTGVPGGRLPPGLSGVDFQENPIATIDKDAFTGSENTLTELTFSGAAFTEFPEALGTLNKLQRLSISKAQIKVWNNDTIKRIGATLQDLTLSSVGLTSWPAWIQYLPHLSTLELSGVSVSVPDNAFDNQINTLLSLNLENGILTEIPSAVSKLTKLQYLLMDNNNISRVNEIPASPVLSKIILDNNKISDSGQLTSALRAVAGSLMELPISNNQLTHLPDLSAMTKLEVLYLSNNTISYIGTSKIPSSLKQIELDHNNLQSLDSFMRSGSNLTILRTQYNSIKEILGLDIPASVRELDISFNLLAELTDESFPPSSNMQTLNLDSNPLARISSKAFASLGKLTALSVKFTKITRLPLSLIYLPSTVKIDLDGNSDMICTCMEKDVFSWSRLHHVDIYGECGMTSIYNFLSVVSLQCPD